MMALLEELLDSFVILKQEGGNPFPPVSSGNRNCVGAPLWEGVGANRSHLQHHIWDTPTRGSHYGAVLVALRVNYRGWCMFLYCKECLSYFVVGRRARPGINISHVSRFLTVGSRRGMDLVHLSSIGGIIVRYM